LWNRVLEVQRTQQVETLRTQLWQLRDDSEKAQRIFHSMRSQLENDLAIDEAFREQHGDDFAGHRVSVVQDSNQRALDAYSRLMSTALKSDRLLSDKLRILDTDPKFRLLKFRKEQLDLLVPAGRSRRGREASEGDEILEAPDDRPIDVTELSECLADLSELIDQRDAQVSAMQDFVDHVSRTLHAADEADDDYGDADEENSKLDTGMLRPGNGGGGRTMDAATRYIRDQVELVQRSLQDQNGLLRRILVLNEAFIVARNETATTPGASAAMESSSNILEKLGDALEELDQFSSHLHEGTDFYRVIIPKLEKLQQNVENISTRLTVERLEYDESVRRSRQEEEDARVASEMSSNPHHPGPSAASSSEPSRPYEISGGGGVGGGGAEGPEGGGAGVGGTAPPSAYGPGPAASTHLPLPTSRVEQVNHADGLAVRVDDAKVARLIELGFDPDRAAMALRRYHNDMDQALNDLLGMIELF
jgi:hypothetical protein